MDYTKQEIARVLAYAVATCASVAGVKLGIDQESLASVIVAGITLAASILAAANVKPVDKPKRAA